VDADDCYRILELPQGASLDDIKSAYRRLARKYHPDVNQSDPKATEKFREVKEAYDILSDPSHYTSKTNNRSQYLKQKLKLVQNLIKEKNYYDAVCVVEELRRRYPNDPEVARWQAIAYYHRGNELLHQYRYIRAKEYLTMVLIVDPQNHELCSMAKRALDCIDEVRVVINHASFYGRLAAVITLVISLISPFILSFYTKVFPSFEVILLTFVIMCIPIAFIIGIIARIISRMNIAFGKSARFNKK